MIKIHLQNGADFSVQDNATNLRVVFQCSAEITYGGKLAVPAGSFGPWKPQTDGTWEARHELSGVIQRVTIVAEPDRGAVRVQHALINRGATEVTANGLRTVTGTLFFNAPSPAVRYLHSLNVRHALPPLAPLQPHQPSLLLGRVPYMFLECVAVIQDPALPCFVTGPLTQNLVHRSQQLTWDGHTAVALQTEQELRGIKGRRIAAGETLELDGVYIQFRTSFDANEVFTDYLRALQAANGSRWEKNTLRTQHFHAPWNNFLYWEAREADIIGAARRLQSDFTDCVQWMGLDDGYEKAWVNPKLERRPNGEPKWHWETELIWGHNCPGISFGFPDGLGEDLEKFPSGVLGLAREIKKIGRRPMLWMGLGVSINHPLFKTNRGWFLPTNNGEQGLLDPSIPEVRERLEHVFRAYYGTHGWESVKLDFFTHNFERTDLVYQQGNRTAAEWRRWFFEMIRKYLPEDGFMNLGCDIGMGAPWVAPWADSYRFSNDMRDGSWENVKSNIRWSVVPALGHGFGQPIGDCDSMSIFRDLSLSERTCWADYSHQTGSVIEISGDPSRWTDADRTWLRGYLDEPRAGQRFWFGDAAAWSRDGLPRVVSRWREARGTAPKQLITSLHNWYDQEQTVAFRDWAGPAQTHTSYENLRTGERGALNDQTVFVLPPRSSCLLRTT